MYIYINVYLAFENSKISKSWLQRHLLRPTPDVIIQNGLSMFGVFSRSFTPRQHEVLDTNFLKPRLELVMKLVGRPNGKGGERREDGR